MAPVNHFSRSAFVTCLFYANTRLVPRLSHRFFFQLVSFLFSFFALSFLRCGASCLLLSFFFFVLFFLFMSLFLSRSVSLSSQSFPSFRLFVSLEGFHAEVILYVTVFICILTYLYLLHSRIKYNKKGESKRQN